MTIHPTLAAALADRYRLDRELGAGGMATVYLAHDLKHDRKVAIKVLRPELAAVIGAERFLREIKTIATLQHPHILGLIDSGEVQGTAYYVMPFVAGESLRDRLNREKQLPIPDAVRLASEVAAALDYAHRHGVIHRDIKPENVMLHDGAALVADFGIALAVSSAGGSRMTETGMSLGTPHYMSPEQAMGEREITARSDVYALGAMTYEMLIGEPPFTGPTAQSIVARVVTEQPRPLIPQRRTIPAHVEAGVLTALEKLPADRFASAKELAEALTSPGYGRTVPVTAAASSRSRRWAPIAIGAVLTSIVFGALALAAWLRPGPAPNPVARYSLAFPDSQLPVFAALSRDGAHLVYVGPAAGGAQQLWVKERNQVDAVPIPGTRNPTGFTISPDGQWIALVQNAVLRKIPLTGGAAIPLADSVFFSGVAWLDDGTLVFSSTSMELTRVSEKGGARTKLWQSANAGVAPAMMTPLPSGRGVLFTECNANCSSSALYVFDFKTDSARQLLSNVMQGWYLPTGHLAYVNRNGEMLAAPFDLEQLEVRGEAVAVLNGIGLLIGVLPNLTMSGSGTLVMQTGGPGRGQGARHELVWVDRAGLRTPVDSNWTFRLLELTGNNGWSISRDGKRLAIALTTGSGDDIWVKQLPAGPLSRLTFDSTAEERPRWTPDGQSVMYISSTGALMQRRGDGTGNERTVLNLMPKPILEAVQSPDGSWLVLRAGGRATQRGDRDIIGLRPGIDNAPRPLAADPSYDEAAPALSPDGRWLAYVSDESGTMEVYVRPFPETDGGKWQVSVNGGQAPLWAHSGRELFYVDGDRNMVVTPITAGPSLQLGAQQTLFSLGTDLYLGSPAHYTPFDITADDRRFIMARQVEAAKSGPPGSFVLIENWFEELKARTGSRR